MQHLIWFCYPLLRAMIYMAHRLSLHFHRICDPFVGREAVFRPLNSHHHGLNKPMANMKLLVSLPPLKIELKISSSHIGPLSSM